MSKKPQKSPKPLIFLNTRAQSSYVN